MTDKADHFNKLTRMFIWLSGASAHDLQVCPKAEQVKYVAFGATVLVPCVFSLITAAYAVSTLTGQVAVISAVAVVWSFIILAVDRALLSSYRAHQPFRSKITQLTMRLCIAVLMGLTISHPLTLLIFKDTIASTIEKGRDADINAARTKFDEEKKGAETRLAALNAEIATGRKRWDDSFDAKFLAEPAAGKEAGGNAPAARAGLENQITVAQAPTLERLAAVEKEIGEVEAQRKSLQEEIDHWQAEFEREINGQRSGVAGVGPRAKSIQDDQLVPRRAENQRLAASLDARAKDRNSLRAEAAAIAQSITTAEATKANELASNQRSEQAKMSSLRQQIAEQQAGQFVEQQTQVRASLRQQLDALLAQEKLLRSELTQLVEEGSARVNALRAEPRRDLLKQTLALHKLFNEGAEGGTFALAAYTVLTLLFMLVDTIPVIIKFFSKPGPYDDLMAEQDESIQLALIAKFHEEGATFSKRLQLERISIAEAREAGHEDDARQKEAALNEKVKRFYGSQSELLQKAALKEQSEREQAQAEFRRVLRRIDEQERTADEQDRTALFAQHAKEADEFAQHVRREREAIAQAGKDGHKDDADHREAALNERVQLFYEEAAKQARLARSSGNASGTKVPYPHATTEGNGVARPINGHSTPVNGAPKADEKAKNELAEEIPAKVSLADIVSRNGHGGSGRSESPERLGGLSPEAEKYRAELQARWKKFAEDKSVEITALRAKGDNEDTRRRAQELERDVADYQAKLNDAWNECRMDDETARNYAL